jgi:hypothetical protein
LVAFSKEYIRLFSTKPLKIVSSSGFMKTSKVVGKIVKSVNKVKVLKTVKIRKQVIDLFDKIKPNNQITIGYKGFTIIVNSKLFLFR